MGHLESILASVSGPLGVNLGPQLVNFEHLGVESGSLRVHFRFLKTICTLDSR